MMISACGQTDNNNNDNNNTITIYTTIYPLYDFASKIGGDRAEVINLVPTGTEAHDFEPTSRDMIKLSDADIFLYNGSGFEPWIDDVLKSLDTSKMNVIDMSQHIDLLHEEEEDTAHEESENNDEHAHEGVDPHYWLDPMRAKQMAAVIKDAMIEVDNNGKKIYEENFHLLQLELDKLHTEYKNAIAQTKRKELIVSHKAFSYLADRYELEQVAISGISPSDEPSQKELKQIIEFAKAHDVKYILFETLVSGKVADVVKREIGAESLTLNPLEGLTKDDVKKGKDYFSVMRDNLESLKKALGS